MATKGSKQFCPARTQAQAQDAVATAEKTLSEVMDEFANPQKSPEVMRAAQAAMAAVVARLPTLCI